MEDDSDDHTKDEFPDINFESESSSSHDFAAASHDQLTADDSGNSTRTIGRYRLLHLVGEGGMGQVWRAIQEEPVRRTVALKLIGQNVGKDALGRFEAERQAIAMMDHPNIARILDADTTEEGSPYFVMELVKGIPLDQYCNNRKLGIEERLRLMIPVCRAIQHAHQKAIIHRDLKHSNILVAENDNKPVPKVIDFGLAKALGSQKLLTDTTVYTEYGKVVGTIAYMSPEQADSGEMDVDTRSDIFSLGVVLYKLLTGRTPIQMEGNGLSVLGAIKIIKDKDATAPSVAVRSSKQDPDCWVSRNTKLSADKYAEQLKGDLDSIVLKALEKKRRDRYETANEFAEDIERFLNREPVQARPRNAVYSLRKFVQRNRGLVASVMTILLLLLAGIIGTTSALLYALQAQRKTEKQLWALQLKSTYNDWEAGNTESAWQTLRQIDSETASWTSRYLANEMYTCDPADIFNGHAHLVITTDVSPDGKYFISGGADDTVHLWDAKSNEKLYRKIMDEFVYSVRFSPDGKSYAVLDRSNCVYLFETESGNLIKKYGKYLQDVSSIAFHPSSKILAFGFFGNDTRKNPNGSGRLWEMEDQDPELIFVDIETGETLQKVEGHRGEITSLEFNRKGTSLFSSCFDGKLRIWKFTSDATAGVSCKLQKSFNANPGGTYELALSPDESKVVCVGKDKVASVFSTKNGELICRLSGHTADVLGVDYSPDGSLIATAANDQTVIIWDLKGNVVKTFKGHSGPINEVRFFGDGRQIVTASDDLTLRRWSLDTPAATIKLAGYGEDSIWQADFSPDKRMVAAVGEDGVITLMDTRSGKIRKSLHHGGSAFSLAWLQDGRLLTAGDTNDISVWDQPDREGGSEKPLLRVRVEDDLIWDISVSHDQRYVVVAGSSGNATVLDAMSLRKVAQLVGHQQGLASAKFSADGRYLVTASDDKTVKVWDAESFELLETLEGHKQPVWRAVFSPTDSGLIASSSSDGSVWLWDWKNASVKLTLAGHSSEVAGLTFTSDGKCLLSASDDGTVVVWDVEMGTSLFVFEDQPPAPVIHASFSRDGQSLVTAGAKKVTVRHARPGFVSPYLRRDAKAEMLKYEFVVIKENIDTDEIRKIEQASQRAVRRDPNYISLRNLGIAQYRLEKFDQAVETLTEALRVQKTVHRTDDIRPLSEGYLAMALKKIDRLDEAQTMKTDFDAIQSEKWTSDPEVQTVRKAVEKAFAR